MARKKKAIKPPTPKEETKQVAQRGPDGRFLPGNSMGVGGYTSRHRSYRDWLAAAIRNRMSPEDVANGLIAFYEDKDNPPNVRFAAFCEAIDRGYGKAPMEIKLESESISATGSALEYFADVLNAALDEREKAKAALDVGGE
jgi:hypothetical protein